MQNNKNNQEQNKKKRKILLGVLIPFGVLVATAAIVTPICLMCANKKISIQLTEDSTPGVKIKESNIVIGKDSTVTLELPTGTKVDKLEIKIGDKTLADTDYTIDANNKITIKGQFVNGSNIVIKVITKQDGPTVSGLSILCEAQFRDGEAFKANHLVVKTKLSDGSTSSTPLNWKTEYSIAKGETVIDNFDTVGYVFTAADATAGHVDFKVTYLAEPSINDTISIIVSPTIKSVILDKPSLDFSIDSATTKELKIKATIGYQLNADKVTWSVEGDDCIQFPQQSSSGEEITVVAKKLGKATLKATAGSHHATCTIDVGCDNFVIVDGDKTYTDVQNLCSSDSTKNITGKLISSTNEDLDEPRATFNKKVVIGKNTTTIEQYFLRGCKVFNQEIIIPNSVTKIGGYFLYECETFNQEFIIPNSVTSIDRCFLNSCITFNKEIIIPNSVTSIGIKFLNNCESFNNGESKGASTKPFIFPNTLNSTFDYLFGNCKSFNQKITLPVNTKFTQISNGFLSDCEVFDQPIIIPNSVTEIGQSFLSLCKNFNSTIQFSNSLEHIGENFLNECEKFNQPLILPASLVEGDPSIDAQFLLKCKGFKNIIDFSAIENPADIAIIENMLEEVPDTNTIKFKIKKSGAPGEATTAWKTKLTVAIQIEGSGTTRTWPDATWTFEEVE